MDRILQSLASEVFLRRPVLSDIFERFGQKSVFDYVQSWGVTPGQPRAVFLQQLYQLVTEEYGEETAISLQNQLHQLPLVSTIDHHGLLNHPFFLNANFIYSLHTDIQHCICLTTAGISLNNSSWPGCLVYDEVGKQQRISLFREACKHQTVLGLTPFTNTDIDVASHRAAEGRVRELLEVCRGQITDKEQLFWQQAGRASTVLWNKFFPSAPKISYIPIEILTNRIIIELLKTNDPIFSLLLCSVEGHKLITRYFQGMDGAFSSTGKGSFLYWGLCKGKRVSLSDAQDTFIGGNLSFPYAKEKLINAMENTEIYPTSLLCFMVMLYCNITCLGGFNQVTWLAEIQKQFILLLRELGLSEAALSVEKVIVNNFSESNLVFMNKGMSVIQASGVDIFCQGKSAMYERYVRLSHRITVAESVTSALPEMYRVVVPVGERNEKLLAITQTDIATHLGLPKKIAIEFS